MQGGGWHPDPTQRHELRYWDGQRWTEHVSDGGLTGSDPFAATAPPQADVTTRFRIPNPAVVLGGVMASMLMLGTCVGLIAASGSNEGPDSVKIEQSSDRRVEDDLPFATTTERQRQATTTTTTTTAPAPTTTAAPLAAAAPPPTTAVPPTTSPPTTAAPTTTAPPTTAAPAPQPASQSDCHPSYEGTCIPPDVSDADCAGGGGNGPHFVEEKSIRVVGTDVFDLDRDGNGLGCES